MAALAIPAKFPIHTKGALNETKLQLASKIILGIHQDRTFFGVPFSQLTYDKAYRTGSLESKCGLLFVI